MTSFVFPLERITSESTECFIKQYKDDLLKMNWKMALLLDGSERIEFLKMMLPEIDNLPHAVRNNLKSNALLYAHTDDDVELAKLFPDNVTIGILDYSLTQGRKDLSRFYASCDVDLNREIDANMRRNIEVAKRMFENEPEIRDKIVKLFSS